MLRSHTPDNAAKPEKRAKPCEPAPISGDMKQAKEYLSLVAYHQHAVSLLQILTRTSRHGICHSFKPLTHS